ncbi:MAG: small multi-drug export protein [Candidatus Wildermuthbacteria bacterium]|nr:small multi-drug export protein [Candidatus Wildermuthbacteria bacterium]
MDELKTFFIAMIPVVELRGAIPIALEVYHLPLWKALPLSVLGNLISMIAIVFAGKFLFKIIPGVFVHAENAHHSSVARYGKRAVVFILSAIPVPFVGGLTGAVAAVVFGVPFKEAVLLMGSGLVVAGIIVSAVTLGIANIL